MRNTKRMLSLRKRYVFVIEKYVKDIRQGQKNVPDLLASITKLTDLAKEELWRMLMNMTQFRPKMQEYRVCAFWMSGKSTDFRRRLPAGPE